MSMALAARVLALEARIAALERREAAGAKPAPPAKPRRKPVNKRTSR